MDRNKYYITTPIYYPSGKWHIGTCYTTVICDALAQFRRMEGKEVFFLTGTDEHGQKIETNAREKGVTPKELADKLVGELKELWRILGIRYDDFIRTTDKRHEETVQKVFTELYEKGDIYKSEYEGWYCTPCESFWTESQLADGKCPDCGREVKKEKEQSYFFRLSKYQKRLEDLYESNPEFLQPVTRVNEMLNNFIRPGLTDLAVTRKNVKWGIPVPFDPDHTIYVWIDALVNYLSALGYGTKNDELYRKFWPADVHMVGKEIVRFHAIIWPALLMALDLPLPDKIYGHGWLLINGDKLSKSKNNAAIADPFMICERYGVDSLRYFILREVPFGKDGVFTPESFITRHNGDLCNDLGNLVSRTTAMIVQYFGGILPAPSERVSPDDELIAVAEGAYARTAEAMNRLSVSDALEEVFRIVQRSNKYIDETMPWVLAKTEGGKERLAGVLYNLVECIRIAGLLISPFLPSTGEKIFRALGFDKVPESFETARFGVMEAGAKIEKCPPLFLRYDVKKEAEAMNGFAEKTFAWIKAEMSANGSGKETDAKEVKTDVKEVRTDEKPTGKPEITIDDFMKVDLATALVTAAEKVEKKDKLLKITLDVGGETRTVVSGIAQHYKPEELVGKTVVLVKNLKPAKLGGVMSEGMILCADADGKVVFVTPEKPVESGRTVR